MLVKKTKTTTILIVKLEISFIVRKNVGNDVVILSSDDECTNVVSFKVTKGHKL
jgi:hypothetical protein